MLTEGLASYLIKAVEPIHATTRDRNFPVWTMTPYSEVSHLALFVGALCSGLDDLGAFRDGPGQVGLRVPRPFLLGKRSDNGYGDWTPTS